ncbi:tetratricopeptide repeat protein [Sphingomonas floccifaciens]|uniref:Tetratricopeptide repeat protein n=1 Tax=Sphingomonas floccifaciens TaxID=1844115 RepID=A0ABW4NI63_9SPHN
MTKRTLIAAALLTSVPLAGGVAAGDAGGERRAASQARDAQKALDKRKVAKAVAGAEAAVALDPRNAGYRTLLGKAYLAAGRFPSAVSALSDALSLDPANGTAALHLALAQIGIGQWDVARTTLTAHENEIGAADRGLAYALAGDPVTAIAVLTQAARGPQSDAKTRQNLALSLALAGRWNEAKAVASFDMSPADVDARMEQWAAFARPTGAADQVAALLGVVPVEDGGQPQRLALNATAPSYAAAAQAIPAAEGLPQSSSVAIAAAALVSEPSPLKTTSAPVAGAAPVTGAGRAAATISFAPRREIVQPIPTGVLMKLPTTPRLRAVKFGSMPPVPAKPATMTAWTPNKGDFYVQLGAYENAGVAKAAWARLTHRIPALGGHAPSGAQIANGGKQYYRLAVGGFARADANALCRKVRTGGAGCFVRIGAGDATAAWVKPAGSVALAMR